MSRSVVVVIALGLWFSCGTEPGRVEGEQKPLVCAGASCTPLFGMGLVQTRVGNPADFVLGVPTLGGGFGQYTRDNDTAWQFPWTGPVKFGSGDVEGVALARANSGQLIAVGVVGGALQLWSKPEGGGSWSGPAVIGTGFRGHPGIVQGKWGGRGNLELVVARQAGGLQHFWRDGDRAGEPWIAGPLFGGSTPYEAVGLIQSSFGQGNLEVIARAGNRLDAFWREDNTTWRWNGPSSFFHDAAGTFGFLQNRVNQELEVVTPLASGGLGYLQRAAGPSWAWRSVVRIAGGNATAAALLQSSYEGQNLELVARIDGELSMTYALSTQRVWQQLTVFSSQAGLARESHGWWEDSVETGVIGIHAMLLHTGNVLLFGYGDFDEHEGTSGIFNPRTRATSRPGFHGGDSAHPHLFCSGHAFAPDGRAIVVGGHVGEEASLHSFDAAANAWHYAGAMGSGDSGRWYPTVTTLPSGRLMIIGGTVRAGSPSDGVPINNTVQIFNPANDTIGPKLGVPLHPFSTDGFGPVDLYPFVFVLPDGRALVHSHQTTRFYNPGNNSWAGTALVARHNLSRTFPTYGSAVLLPLRPSEGHRARVMMLGGSSSGSPNAGTPATGRAEVLDLGAPSPQWTEVAPMHKGRVMPDAVLLPDGTVLAVGGSATGMVGSGTAPVLLAEIYDPGANSWRALAPMRVPRLYHSVALLLPDARVLVAGHDGLRNPVPYKYPEHRVELYQPPYLQRGPRPVIGSAPSSVGYNALFAVSTSGPSVSKVVLIKTGSVTHGFNMDQRLVELSIASASGGSLSVRSPPNANVAPPGYYLLFALTSNGIPSEARFVQVR
jgi:hypothetical protein